MFPFSVNTISVLEFPENPIIPNKKYAPIKMPFTLGPLLGGTLLSMVEAAGDYSLKRYAQGAGNLFFAGGLSVYGLLAVLLAWLFQTNGLAIINTYWDGTSNIINMLVAAFLLKEVYSVRQWIGMILVGFGLFIVGN